MSVIDFGSQTLPYGVFVPAGRAARVGVAIGTNVLDLFELLGDSADFEQSSLNAFMSRGPERWAEVRRAVQDRLAQGIAPHHPDVHRQADVEIVLPIEVADFVDFFSGIEHATNAGNVLRPGEDPLKSNYRHLPVGYHGRAGTVVAAGTAVVRPWGQIATHDGVVDAPTRRLDLEVELGYVVGVPSPQGSPVPVERFREHVFGVVVLVDWSARDIQAWEYQPLGPFLGKSFATTISSWVVPLAALDGAWIAGPRQEPEPLAYLRAEEPRNPHITLELELQGRVVSRLDASSLYWSPAQQMAHMVHNGASLRTGDVYGTGTISSFERTAQGSMLEISWGGTRPLEIPGVGSRTYLEDGDEIVVRACVAGDAARPIGTATGRILPAPDRSSGLPLPR